MTADPKWTPGGAALRFVRWALTEGSWRGHDLDGGSIQEMALELGLIVETKFDPAKHGDLEYADEAEPGDPLFLFAPGVEIAIAHAEGAKRR